MFFSPDFKSKQQVINAACFGSRQEVISSLILPLNNYKGSRYTTGVGRRRDTPASPPYTLEGSPQWESRCWKSEHFIHSRAYSKSVVWYSLPLGYWCLLRRWWKPGTCSAENVTYLPIMWGSQMPSCLSVDSRLSFWSLNVVFQPASSRKRYQWRCAQCSDLTATRHTSIFTPATTHIHKTVNTLSFTNWVD